MAGDPAPTRLSPSPMAALLAAAVGAVADAPTRSEKDVKQMEGWAEKSDGWHGDFDGTERGVG